MTGPVSDRPCYYCGQVKPAEELVATGPRGYPICRSCLPTDIDAGTPAAATRHHRRDAERRRAAAEAEAARSASSRRARREESARAEAVEQAGWNGAFWILGYPVGVFFLLVIWINTTIAERGCSRFGDCPGGLSDWFIVRIRSLNGGPPQLLEWVVTLLLIVAVAAFGWRNLRLLTLPVARLQIAVNGWLARLFVGPDRTPIRPPNPSIGIRQATPEELARIRRPGRLRFMVAFLVGGSVWLAFTSIGVLAPWLIGLFVLLAVP